MIWSNEDIRFLRGVGIKADVEESHKQPPHKRCMLDGCEVWSKTCPSCHAEVLTLIHEFKAGKVVRTFCHLCAESKTDEGMGLVR